MEDKIETIYRGRTVRTAQWRLTERTGGKHELYHLPSDPGEYHNVIAQPKTAGLAKVLVNEFGE